MKLLVFLNVPYDYARQSKRAEKNQREIPVLLTVRSSGLMRRFLLFVELGVPLRLCFWALFGALQADVVNWCCGPNGSGTPDTLTNMFVALVR